jgi:hypothetical protein
MQSVQNECAVLQNTCVAALALLYDLASLNNTHTVPLLHMLMMLVKQEEFSTHKEVTAKFIRRIDMLQCEVDELLEENNVST